MALTPQPSFSEIIDLKLLKRWWPYVAAGGIMAGVLAAAYVVTVAPAYEAEVRVVVQNAGLGIEGTGARPVYDKEFLSTQAEIIRSPATIARSLHELPPSAIDSEDPDADPIEIIAESLRVNLLAGTDIVRLTYEHSDPEYAAARLKSIVTSYQTHVRDAEQTAASQAVKLLSRRESELAQQLDILQKQLLEVRSGADHSVTGETSRDSPLLKELTNRWVALQADLVATQAELAASSSGDAINLASSVVSREIVTLENDLFEARARATAAAQVLGPDHPERLALDREVSTLQAEVTARQQQMLSALVVRSQQLVSENESLKSMIHEESERLKTATTSRYDAERLQAQIAQVADIHGSTATALESVQLADRTLAEGRSSIIVDVIDEFTIPQKAVWPQPIPLISVAVMLGGLLALAASVVVESYQRLQIRSSMTAATQNPGDEEHMLQKAQRFQQEVERQVRPQSKSADLLAAGGER